MRVVFFGTPMFSAQILKYLVEKQLDIVAIVTQPDKLQGRHLKLQEPAVKKVAKELFLTAPILQPEKISTNTFLEEIEAFKADIFVVVAFGQIFPTKLLELPRLGCVNVHTSLLPKYRGAAPIQRCLMEGEEETGVSVMYMVKALDAGDVLATKKIAIDPSMNAETLSIALCELSKELLYTTLIRLDQGEIVPKPQNPAEVTYAKKVNPEDAEVLWQKDAVEIVRQFRGVSPKPGAWCRLLLRGKETRLKLIEIAFTQQTGAPGDILSYLEDGIVVAAQNGSIKISKLQIEGKKAVEVKEFIKGYSLKDVSFKLDSSNFDSKS